MKYDLVIIGGGSIGYSAAGTTAFNKKKVEKSVQSPEVLLDKTK